MGGNKKLERLKRKNSFKRGLIRIATGLCGWIGVAVLYYLGISMFFDTPVERELKQSTQMLRQEYTQLTQQYNTLNVVLENVVERDKSVFRTLFESDPHSLNSELEYIADKVATYDLLLKRPYDELRDSLGENISHIDLTMDSLNISYHKLQIQIDSAKQRLNYIPSIQPILNNDLTLIAAPFGVLMHPFYKTLQPHEGVDYAVPEGSSVFATADGVVKQTYINNSTLGRTILIDHGYGYKTFYGNLSKTNVRRGQRIRRGDIIALSGNTGLSIAPHLHYEVRHNDIKVDPIDYFFMELSPQEYQRIIRIAQQGTQSFD